METDNIPSYSFEKDVSKKGFLCIAGVDEVGRGPVSGPVVAGAVRIPHEYVDVLLSSNKIKDSKKLSAIRREEAYDRIIKVCDYGVGIINNDIIDEINILEATKLAMMQAINDLDYCDYLLVDGNVKLNLPIEQQQIIKGDNLSISIAAGSIIAKVTRDRIMKELHEIFPIYGWDRNKGYPTAEHREAIKKYGITEFHRLSFAGIGK